MADSKRARMIASVDEDFDMRGLTRLGAWGLSALAAVVLAIVAARSDIGARRAMAAFEPAEPPAAVTLAPVIAELRTHTSDTEHEMRQLTSAVRTLNDDRDQLKSRIASVEHDIRDLKGSLTRTLATLSAAKPAVAPEAKPARPEATIKPLSSISESKPSITESVSTDSPHDKNAMPSSKSHATITPTAERVENPATSTGSMKTETAGLPIIPASSAPAGVPHPDLATPSSAKKPSGPETTGTVPVRLPLPKPAAAPASPGNDKSPGPASVAPTTPGKTGKPTDTASSAGIENEALPKVEIGLDLGPALTLSRLRSRWNDLKSKHRTLFEGMRPLVALRETAQGKSVEIRLVIGPVADIQTAAEVCAALAGTQFMCQPAVFDGQRLGTR